MPRIQIARRGSPVQVDDFPNEVDGGGGTAHDFKRSCEGALHLRPGALRSVTDDELHHIQATPAHAGLASRITVLPDPKPVAASRKAKPAAAKFDDGKKDNKKPSDKSTSNKGK
ncbi:hypothetical protein LCGC14_0835830 [marine sediment metagenome]|uniref:Uncharacterized protein n=1 Tax=marine sediment metagenome TaxID=412755 RepID=A0A0F9SM20_9ZZZZ